MMHAAALVVIAATLVPSSPLGAKDARAADVGRTLRVVEELRAHAAYEDAVDEVNGLMKRWYDAGISGPDMVAEADRMRDLLRDLVGLDEASQAAESNPRAARRYLRMLIDPAQPTGRSIEQAHALTLLAKHDSRVQELLDNAFPARIVVEIAGDTPDPALQSYPFENSIVELSHDAFPIVHDAGASVLHVRITTEESTARNGLIEGTRMKAYAMHMSAEIVGNDGVVVAKVATSLNVLGIDPGNAAHYGMVRCAQALYQQLVDEIAKKVALG